MHTSNLLPEKYKKDYKLYIALSYIKRFLLTQIVITVILMAGFMAYSVFLNEQIQTSADTLNSLKQTQEKVYLDDALSLLQEQSQRMEAAAMILEKKPYLNLILDELIIIIPADITLDTLEIQTNPEEIKLTGRAKTRERVVELQENLQNSELLEISYAPLSNLTQAKDASFSFTASYNLEDVIKFEE